LLLDLFVLGLDFLVPAACIGGALPVPELVEIAALVGLQGGRVLESFDCFAATEISTRVASDLDVHAVNFFAAKPAEP